MNKSFGVKISRFKEKIITCLLRYLKCNLISNKNIKKIIKILNNEGIWIFLLILIFIFVKSVLQTRSRSLK